MATGAWLILRGAREHNLRNIDVEIPLGMLIAVTGVSGSGKSTLVNDILYRALSRHVYGSRQSPGAHDSIEGLELIDKVIEIDQSPIGRTPAVEPGHLHRRVHTHSRPLRDAARVARARLQAGPVQFQRQGRAVRGVPGRRLKRIEMNFLPDVYVTCDACRGKRYNLETLQVKYKGKSIADLLETTVEEARHCSRISRRSTRSSTLNDVGLGYIHLGQSATTLSGGEAQRIKLARELSRRQTGHVLHPRRADDRAPLRRCQ
jgi:excinuclease ABC subunit A